MLRESPMEVDMDAGEAPVKASWLRGLGLALLLGCGVAGQEVEGVAADLQITHRPGPRSWQTKERGLDSTHLRLASRPDGRTLWEEELPSMGISLGYRAETHSFLLGQVGPRGAWLALAAATNPTRRFLVFVGGRGRRGPLRPGPGPRQHPPPGPSARAATPAWAE